VGLAEQNPVRAVKAPKLPKLKPKALDQEEVERLVDACRGSLLPRRDKAIILFLLDSGCRASELAGIRDGDVDFERGRARVMGKGSNERFVYLGRSALSALWLYVNEERPEHARPGDDHLFLLQDGYPMDRNSLRKVFDRRNGEAGVHASPHRMRHSAAIAHLRGGMDLLSLQRLLGHESLETTRVYLTALADEDVERAARRTSPADNWRL
jgi:site-specific recombinase XerD